MPTKDQTMLQDWAARLMIIVDEIRASKGSDALQEEADGIESAADNISDLAGE